MESWLILLRQGDKHKQPKDGASSYKLRVFSPWSSQARVAPNLPTGALETEENLQGRGTSTPMPSQDHNAGVQLKHRAD